MRFAVPALVCAAWTLIAGKDLNWDLLHYHFYLPYSLLGGRLEQDYFAASTQSYLNPLGYLPFYLAVSAGWHSVVVSALLAAVHGLNIGLLYLVSRRLFPQGALALLATALGAASAVFWATAGTSFLDPLLTVPMLAGTLLLLQQPARAGWAGLLFGAAAALKYSNAFFALAALVLVRDRRALLAYVLGGGAAVAALAGPWMFVLYREFGNPFFPNLNSLFRSPDFPAIALGPERFAPRDLAEGLSFPFRMMSPEFMTYAEISAPDLRFAALLFACLGLALVAMVRRGRALLGMHDARFLAFVLIASLAWIWTSGNARYGMLVLLLVGPCLARVVELAAGMHVARIVVPVVLVAQVVACAMISPLRWGIAERWTREWFPFAVPERAQREPALYLTLEAQTMMAVAPFLHRESSFVNVRGQHSLVPGSKRVAALLAQHEGRVRALGRGLRLQPDGSPRSEAVEAYDSTLLRFGFRVDTADCFAIGWQGERSRALALASCALARAERDPRDVQAEARVTAIFDRIERDCARLFRGHSSVTEPLGEEWSRTYVGLEARLQTHGGRVALVRLFKPTFFDLGSLVDWERPGGAAQPEACRDAR